MDFVAHHYLGLARARTGRFADALEHYRTAVELDAGYHPAYDSLARLRAAHDDPRIRDAREAVRLAEAACEMTDYRHESYLHTLAMAYAADGRFDLAITTAERALDLARRHEKVELLTSIEDHLALFRRNTAVNAGR